MLPASDLDCGQSNLFAEVISQLRNNYVTFFQFEGSDLFGSDVCGTFDSSFQGGSARRIACELEKHKITNFSHNCGVFLSLAFKSLGKQYCWLVRGSLVVESGGST